MGIYSKPFFFFFLTKIVSLQYSTHCNPIKSHIFGKYNTEHIYIYSNVKWGTWPTIIDNVRTGSSSELDPIILLEMMSPNKNPSTDQYCFYYYTMHNGNLVKKRKMWNFHYYAGKTLWSAINSVLAVFKGLALLLSLCEKKSCDTTQNQVEKYQRGKNFDLWWTVSVIVYRFEVNSSGRLAAASFKHLLWCLLLETAAYIEACVAFVTADGANIVPWSQTVGR